MKQILCILFFLFAVLSLGQERTVFGTVIDKNNQPLTGAYIVVNNTTKGVYTDFNGNYSLKNVTPNDTLVFSFISFETQKIIADKDTINVQMQEDDRNFGREVVYITYKPKKLTAYNIKNVFEEEAKNNRFIIFISEFTIYSNFSEEDLKFQEKYNVIYSSTNNYNVKTKYLKKYNKLTFKHLNKKYNKSWKSEIRKDAIGIDDFLK
jgi:hypothetical protein